jgi:uncharacterized membrane protein AbrB (regulator of aidB expression)
VAISLWVGNASDQVNNHTTSDEFTTFGIEPFAVTMLFVLFACIGYLIGKRLKFPAPWLIGSDQYCCYLSFWLKHYWP